MAMNPMGGIDQQIQQRKMQFKDNPQQLQQRYGQNKQLLDLLALQEISKEQQQRSQRMQMEAQQNPATVADQMQQEVLQGKKAEMAQGLQGIKGLRERTKDVGGVLAQKQQQQQQRMQQQGQQPQRPPQQQQRPQGQPMMAAAGGLMTQAAPNIDPRYFEGGGIVAFKAGGPTAEEIEEYVRLNPAVSREEATEYLTKRKLGSSARETVETYRDEKLRKFKDAMAARRAQDEPEVEEIVPTTSAEELERQALADAAGAEQIAMARETIGADAVDAAPALPTGTAAADETELSTLQQVLKGAKQFGLPDDSAVPDAPLAQAKPVDDYLLNPAAQAARQGDRQRAAFSANEARLNMGMPAGGLETLDRSNLTPTQGGRPLPGAPEMLRRAPEKELTLEQEYEALRRKQLADLKRDEEGLKDTRSNTRRLLDRLTDAAVNASKRPASTTNRGALASFGTGISEAVRAEKAERKEGLAGIRDRRSKLLGSELERKQALAQIEQGERGLDLKSTELANNLGINLQRLENDAQRLNMDTERYANALAQSSREFAVTAAFKAMDLDAQAAYRRDTAALKTRELDLKDKATKARTDASKQALAAEVVSAIADAKSSARESEANIITTLRAQGFTGDELNTKVKEAVTAIKTDTATLIASLNAIASGTGIAMPASGAAGGGAGGAADGGLKITKRPGT